MPKNTTVEAPVDVDAVVVGAGFAGLYMLRKLDQLGLTSRGFEAGDGVGGTWFWNRYPGARCDVESVGYSYSFDPELEQEWVWSERYPAQPEIESYLNHVADRFHLRDRIAMETKVTSAVFDEDTTRWTVATDRGDQVTCRWFITAVGCLSEPKTVDIPGVDTFAGEHYDTSRWPKGEVDLAGKRVAVIGTGSSGVQAIPKLAEVADQLYVFQRTPNFSVPAWNRPLSATELDEVKSRYRNYRADQLDSFFGQALPPGKPSAVAATEAERHEVYQAAWDLGSISAFLVAYDDLLISQESNDTAAQFIRDKIAQIVADPEVAEDLSPTEYPMGTKRPCMDTGYYETYNRPNVKLINIKKTPIVRVVPNGIETSEGVIETDVIVFATGFDAMVGALNAIEIRGRDGRVLRDEWSKGPRTYLGLAVHGYPNMFVITGPQSPSVLSNMVVSIEQHVNWIGDCIQYVTDRSAQRIEAAQNAQDEWVEHVATLADTTLFPKAKSWYIGANVPGKPRVFMPYVGGIKPYRELCDSVAAKAYEGFDVSD
ncbi:flavin-containing monooxygenase [Pseudonocardia sp. RS010]|uniref:flavin-containing monooxygenase n=1 Tax=Pseudonocardia sp. RS010 TaxID=3385979 RepID=UPI0039A25217